tara:strand:+ start:15317 stop:15661 length:345 start_codon:yes stop_codon:yes gene_type:complete
MSIQISGTTIITDSKTLSSGLTSAYDNVYTATSGTSIGNRQVVCLNGEYQTVTLPSSPSSGNEVVIVNGGAYKETIVARNGQRIMGLQENMKLDLEYVSVRLIFINSANGWRVC